MLRSRELIDLVTDDVGETLRHHTVPQRNDLRQPSLQNDVLTKIHRNLSMNGFLSIGQKRVAHLVRCRQQIRCVLRGRKDLPEDPELCYINTPSIFHLLREVLQRTLPGTRTSPQVTTKQGKNIFQIPPAVISA